MQTQQHFHIYMYISHTYQEQKVSPDMLFTDTAPVDVLVNKTCSEHENAIHTRNMLWHFYYMHARQGSTQIDLALWC